MKFYVGVTDNEWFDYLSKINPEDINFWKPGGTLSFNAVPSGAPFLLKLKSPNNAVGGVGFFSSHSLLPISVAWDIFENRNGAPTFSKFQDNIKRLRNSSNSLDINPNIGCVILTNPIFFRKEDWIPIPENWKGSIQQGKTYTTEEFIGKKLWDEVEKRLEKYRFYEAADEKKNQLLLDPQAQYGKPVLQKVRLGQGAFRVLVTDAYGKRCAISGERTLPVLEAAHIKQYSESGPHLISNALLLRSDIHKLFDTYYLTISPEYKIEVSKKIKEEFENGREYYKFHGNNLLILPGREIDRPRKDFIEWHNSKFKV